MRLKIFIGLLLTGVTLAVYWPARHFEMIDLDDAQFMDIDPAAGLNGHGIHWAMTAVVMANWHPVTTFSFLLAHRFFGVNPGAEHGINIIFHAANAALLFLVLQRMTGATWRSGVVAAIFAWHPLRVESVAWIAERKDVLFMFFMLLALLCYERYAKRAKESPGPKDNVSARADLSFQESMKLKARSPGEMSPPSSRPSPPGEGESSSDSLIRQRSKATGRGRVWYALALFFFVFSLMSKSMMVTQPFLLLLLDFWPLQRLTRSTAGKLVIEKIPFFLLAIVFSALTFWIQKASAAVVSLGAIGVGARLENATLSYINYLGELFWPADLAIIYPFSKSFDTTHVLLDALLLLAISAFCVMQISRRPYLAAGWFWYLGTLIPVIGLVDVGGLAMADRYTYLPMIGPVISLVWLIAEWVGASRPGKVLAASAVAIVLCVGIVLTRMQMMFWQNSCMLFERAAEVSRVNALAQVSLAFGLEEKNLLRQAMVHYRIAGALVPGDYYPHYRLAVCLMREGYPQQAMTEYEVVVADACNPNDYVADLRLAEALTQLKRYGDAAVYLEAALRVNPYSTEAMNNLAWLLATCPDANVRDGARAVQLAERACELTHYNQTIFIGTLAAAYAEAGRFDDAIATAQRAIAMAQQHGQNVLTERNGELLKVYQTHQAYHESE